VQFKTPDSCSGHEVAEFARLVREGFDGSDECLLGRIRKANRLAFHYESAGELAAIAALKAPEPGDRERTFKLAGIAGAADYELELGWVFVRPCDRRCGFAGKLCQGLLAQVPGTGIFATTRPDNIPMKRSLFALGFVQEGEPFPHRWRKQLLTLFLRRGSETPDFVPGAVS